MLDQQRDFALHPEHPTNKDTRFRFALWSLGTPVCEPNLLQHVPILRMLIDPYFKGSGNLLCHVSDPFPLGKNSGT